MPVKVNSCVSQTEIHSKKKMGALAEPTTQAPNWLGFILQTDVNLEHLEKA